MVNSFIAVGWNDRKLKVLVASVGQTAEANSPDLKKRITIPLLGDQTTASFVQYYKEVKQPSVVEQYFNAANTIDIHNHYRQGGLQLERRWHTHTWWHRNFATLIGICETKKKTVTNVLKFQNALINHRNVLYQQVYIGYGSTEIWDKRRL